jgi:hypothetical protein
MAMKNHEGLSYRMSRVARLLVSSRSCSLPSRLSLVYRRRGGDSLGPLRHTAHFAPDHTSLFYAYGYANGSARGIVVAAVRAGRGRGAEFYGDRRSTTHARRSRISNPTAGCANGIPERAKVWRLNRVWSLRRFCAPWQFERVGPNMQILSAPAKLCCRSLRKMLAHGCDNPLRLDRQPGQSGNQAQERE